MTIAIIGGTGLETLPSEWDVSRSTVTTPFGAASVCDAVRGNQRIVFLSRHGESHGLAPHAINYQANVAALTQLGIRVVLATNAVGSLRLDLPPGSLVALDDFIDHTHARPKSFWDNHPASPGGVVHTDFSNPYCPLLRGLLIESAAELEIPLTPRATYVCCEGPRFESPAEVKMLAQWGGDVVGMTGLPEAIFAREAGLCYAAVGIVTNFGCGLTSSAVRHNEVVDTMLTQVTRVRELLLAAGSRITDVPCPTCSNMR